MASSCLSNDERNFQCVAVASVDLIKLPLRDILASHIKPTDLFQKIKSCSTLNLRQEQLKICLAQPPDYNSFDVSLLYTLIRNLCSLPSPTQGWGKEPKSTDTQISDDIERLRLFRNIYYAHAESARISECLFKDIWRNLKLAIKRIQSRCNVNYEDELIRIEQSKYTLCHWQECMTLLNAYASKQNQADCRDEPAIFIQGENEIFCGGTARFEADVKNVESSCWSITWQKRRGDVIKRIDTNMGRYSGSAKKTLVINSVCKEDEGEYQAALSLESNGPEYKSRNIIRLHAIGEKPYVDILGVTSGSEGIAIHYKCGTLEQSPKVHQLEWSKNGEKLDNNSKKYTGGSVQDSCFTIKSPTNDDRGNYSCKVTNAVGSVSTTISLDIPSVEIFIDSPVCFGSETTIKSVVSTSMPTPEKIEWQESKDGVDFNCIGYAKYPQITNNFICPSFVINETTFDDKRYYRLLVWNGIGESVSNTVYLNVTGSPPNITTSFETNIKNRSVKLIGNLYYFNDSPGTLETFWTKDDEKIKTKESGRKLSDISNDSPSLTITNVCPDDAGEYRLTAINAVGSSTSDVIVLGVPTAFVNRVERIKYGDRRITVTIKSLPAPCHIQWSAKTKDDNSFTPIDTNAEEYKGTTVSFPNSVLVVRQRDQPEEKCYQIEVMNFIGKTVQDILGNIKSTVREKDIVENTFYKDHGARVRFTKLSNVLAKQFPPQKLENLKFTLTNSNIVQNRTSVMEATSALECIRILQDEELFTQTDVIVMQFLCTQTECLDLYDKCIEYAEQQKALCYFEKPSVNGYKKAEFHVQGDLSNYTKQYIQEVIDTVAVILDCKEEDILLNGVRHSTSFLLSLSIKGVYIWELFTMNKQNRLKLIRLNIDYLIIDKETIHLERPEEFEELTLENSTTGNHMFRTISFRFRGKGPFLQNRLSLSSRSEYDDFPNVFSSMEDSFEIFDTRSCVEERFSPELQEHTMTFDGDSRKLENSSFQKRKDFKINIPFESRNLDKKSQPLKSAKQPPRCTPKDILRISTRSKINRKQRFDYLSFQSTNSERHGCTFNSPEAESRPLPLPPIFSPTIITYINTEYGCTSMSCLGDEKIWTCHLNDKILRLYNLQGELMESIRSKSGQYDITVTGTGGLVYTDSKDRTVNIINKGEIQTVISLQEWKPYGLCSTSSGDLLVIIISDDEKQTKVVRYSGSSLKQTIQYNDMGQSLFSSSCNTKYISENRNLDICVSDWSACAVVAVNQSGKLRFTYTGHPSTTKGSFSPVGITTDSQSRILTADLNSSCIHILNQDGQFLHYIKDRYVSLPWGLCVDTKDNLFVSEYITGIVKMIEYCI